MIPIGELKKRKYLTVNQRVYAFLKKHKSNAYRPVEIIKELDASSSTVRASLRKLFLEGKIGRKTLSSNCSYYYYKEVSKNKDNKN